MRFRAYGEQFTRGAFHQVMLWLVICYRKKIRLFDTGHSDWVFILVEANPMSFIEQGITYPIKNVQTNCLQLTVCYLRKVLITAAA